MNLLLLFKEDFVKSDKKVCLRDRRHKHALEVLQPDIGDELCVGLEGGRIGKGRVTCLGNDVLEMDVSLNDPPPIALPVTLILALPRPIMLKRILVTISAMGVKRIILVNSSRVEKSYWQSPVLQQDNIEKQLILGLEQAKDTILPEVLLRPLFKPFVEDELPNLIKETMPILAHPDGQKACPRNVQSSVTLAIGPEGGFIPYEVGRMSACGFSVVNIGKRILRVETAIPAVLARLF